VMGLRAHVEAFMDAERVPPAVVDKVPRASNRRDVIEAVLEAVGAPVAGPAAH
jgi:hypothetical protein